MQGGVQPGEVGALGAGEQGQYAFGPLGVTARAGHGLLQRGDPLGPDVRDHGHDQVGAVGEVVVAHPVRDAGQRGHVAGGEPACLAAREQDPGRRDQPGPGLLALGGGPGAAGAGRAGGGRVLGAAGGRARGAGGRVLGGGRVRARRLCRHGGHCNDCRGRGRGQSCAKY